RSAQAAGQVVPKLAFSWTFPLLSDIRVACGRSNVVYMGQLRLPIPRYRDAVGVRVGDRTLLDRHQGTFFDRTRIIIGIIGMEPNSISRRGLGIASAITEIGATDDDSDIEP